MIVYLTLSQNGTVMSAHGADRDAAHATGRFVLPWNAHSQAAPAIGSVYRA